MLYTTPVWAKALAIKKNKNILKKVQRTALIRTSTAYRTVSHAALCVLTGTMPINLKAELRAENYEIRRTGHQDSYDTCSRTAGTMSVCDGGQSGFITERIIGPGGLSTPAFLRIIKGTLIIIPCRC